MRHFKQLLYGVFYLGVWTAIGTGVYYFFIKPAPTCYDNILNQDEEGVDCGGTCSGVRMCLPALQPVKASMVKVIPLAVTASSTRISLVGEIGNPNIDWAGYRFAYAFNVYDPAGAKLASFPGSSYIYGGEVKYLALPNEEIQGSPSLGSADLVIQEPQWVKARDLPKAGATVVVSRTDTSPVVVARGTVANTEALPETVELTALFYDYQNNIVGVSGTVLERLAPRETREFAIFHPVIDNIASERTRVFASAYTTQ